MSRWTELLDTYINSETRPRKSTDETDETPREHVDETRKTAKPDSFVSFDSDSSGPRFENAQDAESVIERSAIREYDAGFDRDGANMAASRAYDAARQSYEFAHPGRDTAMAEALYTAYLQNWQPDGPGDVPAVPPNTNCNGDLWRQWWRRVDKSQKEEN